MKPIVILGSTGSIGENALRVAAALPGRLQVVGLAVRRDYRRGLEQARQFGARHLAVADARAAEACASVAPRDLTIHRGEAGLVEVATLAEAQVVVCAVVGTAGLAPVLAAVTAGKDVALATKEVLVAAGGVVAAAAARSGARLLPVDSEHSAIFQCLGPDAAEKRGRHPDVRRLLLTASGGPFAAQPDVDFDRVTVEQALAHPRWNMGRKISIDSATLMNKGLEVIEAHWLFGVPFARIEIVVHPESIVHSLVEFVDGSVLAQMSVPDMRFAIQYALTYPERLPADLPALRLSELGTLTFREPDPGRFPCLDLARRAGEAGGTLPAVLNAANEIAVEKFLDKRIAFSGIWKLVSDVMAQHRNVPAPSLEDIIEADRWARHAAREAV